MDQPGKPTTLHGGKPRDLSYPQQRDLTPEEADRVLKKPRRKKRESDEQDPVSQGRGSLEMVFYGIMLIAVVGFQLVSRFEPEEDGEGSPFGNATVTTITVENRVEGTRETVEGNRVSKPDCPAGEPIIRARVADIEGGTLGRIHLETESANGEWQISARGLLSGRARVHAEAAIDCQDPEQEEN